MRSWLPTSSPSPPQLEADIPYAHLRRLLEPVVAVDGQTTLTIGGDALVATSVDDPPVTAVEATLDKSDCQYFEAAPGSMTVDPKELFDVLAAEGEGGELAHLRYDPEASTLRLTLSSFVHRQTVSIDVAVEKPDIDGTPDSVTTYHTRDDLTHGLQYFIEHAAVVAFGYDASETECYLEEITTGEATLEATTRYRCPRKQQASSVPSESVRAAFATPKLRALVEAVPPDTLIRADYADTFPLRLAWDLTGGDGIEQGTPTEVTAHLAPYDVPNTPTTE